VSRVACVEATPRDTLDPNARPARSVDQLTE